MTVSELRKLLGKFDKDLLVCYRCCSELVLLEEGELEAKEICIPRPDGWIQNKRPDMQAIKYLCFTGN